MGRRSSGSYDHKVTATGHADEYEISWVVDSHYSGSRLRFPRVFRRWTDEAGARKFCKRWGLEMPERKVAT